MNRKKKIKHIYDPLFRQNYKYIKAKTFGEFRKIVEKELKIGIPPSQKAEKFGVDLSGRCEYLNINGMRVPTIWVKGEKLPLIVHECWHAVYDTLDKKGIVLSDDSEEVFAYALEFLVRNILR